MQRLEPATLAPSIADKTISDNKLNSSCPKVSEDLTPVELNPLNPEEAPADDEETVPDPFGSYEAPCEIVSPKARTLSTSGPYIDDPEDLDDDALPNLETVIPKLSNSPHEVNGKEPECTSGVEEKLKTINIEESHETVTNGLKGKLKIVPDHDDEDDEEFHDVDDGGFIDDSYCGDAEFKDSVALPSMMSLGPSSDFGPVSGHFMEDSYLPSSETNGSLQGRKTIEFSFHSDKITKISGDFNNWEPQLMEKGSDNSWKLLIDLPEGEYHYKYFVDGDCQLDPDSPLAERDGAKSNVMIVSCEISKN